jgi:cell division protein ZapA
MSAASEPVTVRILEREYRVMCAPSERRNLMDSALFLDQQMREIRDSGRISSVEKIAVMCALNLSEEILKLRQESGDRREKIDLRISELVGRLDQALARD